MKLASFRLWPEGDKVQDLGSGFRFKFRFKFRSSVSMNMVSLLEGFTG
jgi:hypothetical protein